MRYYQGCNTQYRHSKRLHLLCESGMHHSCLCRPRLDIATLQSCATIDHLVVAPVAPWFSRRPLAKTPGRDRYCCCLNLIAHLVVLLVCCQSLHCHGHVFQLIHKRLQLLLILFAVGTCLCMHIQRGQASAATHETQKEQAASETHGTVDCAARSRRPHLYPALGQKGPDAHPSICMVGALLKPSSHAQ